MGLKNKYILEANKKGYKANEDGDIISPRNKKLKLYYNKNRLRHRYYSFSIRMGKKVCTVPVHRLVAFQKYGNEVFDKDLVVRHLDGNSLNNSYKNIALGTQSDNMYDRFKEDLCWRKK